MAGSTADEIVDDLLRRHGRTDASEAGIRLARNTPAPLFQLLCLALLLSARISADIAVAASKALQDTGWTTPDEMAASRTALACSTGRDTHATTTLERHTDDAEQFTRLVAALVRSGLEDDGA